MPTYEIVEVVTKKRTYQVTTDEPKTLDDFKSELEFDYKDSEMGDTKCEVHWVTRISTD